MSVTFYDPKNPVQYDEDYNVTGGCPELNVSSSNARDILLVLGLCDVDGELYGEISAKDLSVLVRRTLIRLNNTSNTTNNSIVPSMERGLQGAQIYYCGRDEGYVSARLERLLQLAASVSDPDDIIRWG